MIHALRMFALNTFGDIPPCIMCVQYIGGCSVHRGMLSTSGGIMSTSEGYHEYIEDVQYIGGIP